MRIKDLFLMYFTVLTLPFIFLSCGGDNNGTAGGSWSTPRLLDLDSVTGATVYAPRVAADNNGDAIAVWSQFDTTNNIDNTWANRYVKGVGWGKAELIETDSTGNARRPEIAVDGNGNAVVIWTSDDGIRKDLWANRYVKGAGWGKAELIETNNTGSVKGGGPTGGPRVAMNEDGDAIAVWNQDDGIRDNIWANRYAKGTGWGKAELIETDNTGGAWWPHVAMDKNGNAIAVWRLFDGTRDNIWANRYIKGAGWGKAELIETDNTGSALNSRIAMDGSGNAIAVWQQNDGTRDNIWANRYVTGTGWGKAELIGTVGTGTSGEPYVAMSEAGDAIAVWNLDDGVRDNIWANRYVKGAGWGKAEVIEQGDGPKLTQYFGLGGPRVAIDGNGNAIAVFRLSDGKRDNIWANRYVKGAGWGKAELVEIDNAGGAWEPDISINKSGDAIAVWFQYDGTRHRVWANIK